MAWCSLCVYFTNDAEDETIGQFKDKLPSTPDFFQICYMPKRSAKRGIENELDLTSMYKQVDDESTITLYCETKSTSADSGNKRKRKESC